MTLHPSGMPGMARSPASPRKSLGMTETHELAVMCDTFHPLRLMMLAKAGSTTASTRTRGTEDPASAGRTPDEDPAGVTSHL